MSMPIIEIKHLGKVFHTKAGEITALKDINLEIEGGEIFGIIGLSGAGKSTLVRCINFLEQPTEGKVIFDGQELGRLNTQELNNLRKSMGMIFQQFNLLMQRTALENVCFPLELSGVSKKQARQKAEELLALVGLSDRMHSYPSQLSGGQKQRVAIARALANDPKVLLCDEATSALDPTTTRSILQLLKDINKNLGITIIIITHEMSVIEEVCNTVAIIDNSTIAEVGSVVDVFARPKSKIAKKLIFSESASLEEFKNNRCIRIIFDGRSSFEPVISNMVMECKTAVNIIFADTKNIDGKAIGQMVIQLPEDALAAGRIEHYLKDKHVKYEEVSKDEY
ncbi:MAG TPA: ATP-binding cassette domain-containing protein [Candidatus Merdenecus merdavium]|nr:ATP-binding cassette domain-containing protein [Candidatus Merdenecus merdavium]